MSSTWKAVFNRSFQTEKSVFPDFWEVSLRPTPVTSISSIQYSINGVITTWPTTEYAVSLSRRRPVIRPKSLWPSIDFFALDPLIVTFAAGYSNASDVPVLWKTAVKALAAHWYENREGVVDRTMTPIPHHLESMLNMLEVY
jgi:uncharacterized phiE125 gp8 family phage protein